MAHPLTPGDYGSFVSETIGITPTLVIRIGLIKDVDWTKEREGLAKATLQLMAGTDWDIALTQGDSTVVLLRKDGNLYVQKAPHNGTRDYHFWTEERLKLINLPYELVGIPYL